MFIICDEKQQTNKRTAAAAVETDLSKANNKTKNANDCLRCAVGS